MAQHPATGLRARFHAVSSGLLAFVAVLVMLFAVPQAGAAFKYVQKGSDVPDFNLTALDGQEVNLAGLKDGKTAVILFWATWSPRSLEEMKFLDGLYREHKDKGFKVVGINVNHLTFTLEDQKAVQQAVAETGASFPIVLDKGLEVYNTFGVVATPSTVVMSQAGKALFEISSFLTLTGEQIRENVETALGVRTAPVAVAAEESSAYKPTRKALLYYNLGRNLLKMGSRDKAMDKLAEAVAEDPKFVAPRVVLGHLLLESGGTEAAGLEKALAVFGEAVAAEPKNVSALSGLGEGLLRAGKMTEAESRFREAIALDATYTPAISGLGNILGVTNRLPEALDKFKDALELNPLNPDVYMRRSRSYESQGMLKEAARDLRKAVELLLGYGLIDREA